MLRDSFHAVVAPSAMRVGQHHPVADGKRFDLIARFDNCASSLVPENDRSLALPWCGDYSQICVAHTCSGELHEDLPGVQVGDLKFSI